LPFTFNTTCDAIRELRLLEFEYGGPRREMQPYCQGLSSAGLDTLRAVQTGGESKTGLGKVKGGKLWTIGTMAGLKILEEKFLPDDPSCEPQDSAMQRMHCRVQR